MTFAKTGSWCQRAIGGRFLFCFGGYVCVCVLMVVVVRKEDKKNQNWLVENPGIFYSIVPETQKNVRKEKVPEIKC